MFQEGRSGQSTSSKGELNSVSTPSPCGCKCGHVKQRDGFLSFHLVSSVTRALGERDPGK